MQAGTRPCTEPRTFPPLVRGHSSHRQEVVSQQGAPHPSPPAFSTLVLSKPFAQAVASVGSTLPSFLVRPPHPSGLSSYFSAPPRRFRRLLGAPPLPPVSPIPGLITLSPLRLSPSGLPAELGISQDSDSWPLCHACPSGPVGEDLAQGQF